MICFQTLYLRSLIPTKKCLKVPQQELWFAFKLCIYVLWYQHFWFIKIHSTSCDLLSNFVFTFFDTNNTTWKKKNKQVVICFQTLYLRSLIPTVKANESTVDRLWFAFKLCIYVLWYQQNMNIELLNLRCDLLSNFVFTFFDTNMILVLSILSTVVICFQTLYLRSLIPTFCF